MNNKLKNSSPVDIIKQALLIHGVEIAISFSGAEDVVLIDLASKSGLPFRVFTLDTGRVFPETYDLFRRVEEQYNIRIEYMFPDTEMVQELVGEKGLFSFYQDGHAECCNIRKVEPLKRALSHLKAWITGVRKDQSATRTELATVSLDGVFKGVKEGPLVKFNPLANWTSEQVWT